MKQLSELSTRQRKQLHDALVKAFPGTNALSKMVWLQLGENLETFVSPNDNLPDRVFKLVQAYVARDQLDKLIHAALKENSTNVALRECAYDLGLFPAPPPLRVSTQSYNHLSALPANTLFTNAQVEIATHEVRHYREEIQLSPQDAGRLKINDGQFAILSTWSLSPGQPEQRCAVRLRVMSRLTRGHISINRLFADQYRLEQCTWYVCTAPKVEEIKRAKLELRVERSDIRREVSNLRQIYQQLFLDRALLIEQAKSMNNLSIPVAEHASFKVSDLWPAPAGQPDGTLLVFTHKTNLNLFVPYSKGGVDMLILIDVSGSMDTKDYVRQNQRQTRLVGVQDALETLIRKRLVVGSRVSCIGIMAFGGKTVMLYPQQEQMEELRSGQIQHILKEIQQKLQRDFLETLQIKQNATNIAFALKRAADILQFSGREGNEKVLILMSDGAHWEEKSTDEQLYGDIESSLADPVSLANTLHERSQLRIHTITVTDEQHYRRYEEELKQGKADVRVNNTAPNLKLLSRIAEVTNGCYLECPDSRGLKNLFREIGRGTTYPLSADR